eukprot:6206976-Pleurochrysis_carterae.AAC.2
MDARYANAGSVRDQIPDGGIALWLRFSMHIAMPQCLIYVEFSMFSPSLFVRYLDWVGTVSSEGRHRNAAA